MDSNHRPADYEYPALTFWVAPQRPISPCFQRVTPTRRCPTILVHSREFHARLHRNYTRPPENESAPPPSPHLVSTPRVGARQEDGGGCQRSQVRLQAVAQRHKLIDPGDDAALLFSRHRQGVQQSTIDQPAKVTRHSRSQRAIANEQSHLNVSIKGSLREVGCAGRVPSVWGVPALQPPPLSRGSASFHSPHSSVPYSGNALL